MIKQTEPSTQKKELESWRLKFPGLSNLSPSKYYPEKWFKKTLGLQGAMTLKDQKWRELMEELFFKGGKIPINSGLPKDYTSDGIILLKRIIQSFEPAHEDKETVCALILKSICAESEN